jgi:glycosyltransferase involved in cell wall biosynthesis
MYTPDGVRQQLVKPDDVANAILTLLRDDNLRKELGEKAFERAKGLTPESRANKFLEIFQNTITNNVMPAALNK